MFILQFRLPGTGVWNRWMPPQTLQAAAGQAGALRRGTATPDVKVTASETRPSGGLDLKV